jgi:hypothetical protein
LKKQVLAAPMWRNPMGLGTNLTRTILYSVISQPKLVKGFADCKKHFEKQRTLIGKLSKYLRKGLKKRVDSGEKNIIGLS